MTQETNQLIQKAHGFFNLKKFNKALNFYSMALHEDSSNQELRLFVVLCDIATEDKNKAMFLFDNYTILKETIGANKALEDVNKMINDFDINNNLLFNAINQISNNLESSNTISYDDFKDLIKDRGSFRKAFEDIMFSVKVTISSKRNLLDFIEKLIDNNFNEIAYTYLDTFNKYFYYDKELISLYDKLKNAQESTNDKS